MCPWAGLHAPSCGRQLSGLPSRVEYLSPQGVLLPRVYGTIASPLWFELRGPAAWQVTPSWAVRRHACHRLLPWLRVTFAVVPDAARPGSDQWPCSTAPATGHAGRLGRPSASDPRGMVRCALSLCCPRCVRVCGVLGHLPPVHRCAHPLSSVRGVRGHLALVRRCARCLRFVCAVVGCVGDPPSFFFSCVCLFFFWCPRSFLCALYFFLMLSRICLYKACCRPFLRAFHPIWVLGAGGGGSPKGLVHNLFMQL